MKNIKIHIVLTCTKGVHLETHFQAIILLNMFQIQLEIIYPITNITEVLILAQDRCQLPIVEEEILQQEKLLERNSKVLNGPRLLRC